MKNISISFAFLTVLAGLAFAAVSCRGGQNNGTETQNSTAVEDGQKGIELQLKTTYTHNPVPLSATIYPDSIVLVRDGASQVYTIDKEKSFERVDCKDYLWYFMISGRSENCLPCDTIVLELQMTDIYKEKSEWDYDRCMFLYGDSSVYCRVLNEPAIQKRLFADHPESKPFPELVMDDAKFYNVLDLDTAKIPSFLLPVKRVVIKDNKIIFSDGEKTTELEMIPLSDHEDVYSEGYDWNFETKATDFCPQLSITLNAGFDFERKLYKPEQRWITLFLKDIGEIQFTFKSWDNLKRMISVSYPSEHEFQVTMEEGILPDYSDEDE